MLNRNYANELVYRLNQAILTKNIPEITLLLEQFNEENINGYDLNNPLDKKRPIDCAVESGSAEIVQMICNKKPKLNEVCDSTGFYPVHLAVRTLKGDELENILRVLYLEKADFRAKEDFTKFTLIHLAIRENKEYLIRPLVKECQCDINAVNAENLTPLQVAIAKYGKESVIVREISKLGGEAYSAATAELHNRFNAHYEKYLKYAKRYPVKFSYSYRSSNSESTEEQEVEIQKITVSPLIQRSVFADTVSDKKIEENNLVIINSHVKALLGGASDLQSDPFGRSGTPPQNQAWILLDDVGDVNHRRNKLSRNFN